MNILYIAPLPPPVTGHSLAAQVLLDGVAECHQVQVVNLSKQSFKQGISSLGRILEVLAIVKEVFARRRDADVVYLTISESVAGNLKDLMIYLVCAGQLDRMVIHLHGGSLKKLLFDRYRLLSWLNKKFLARVAAAVVLGDSHVEIFSGIVARERIYVVPNFAEDFLFAAAGEITAKFSSARPLRVLFMSNLIDGKGYRELAEAYIDLEDRFKTSVRVDFAGGFESVRGEEEFLQQIAPHPGIRYHGSVAGSRKKAMFGEAHIFCLPTSLHEGQPISILEAYASGCVVLTTRQGGIPDVFQDQVNGYEIAAHSAASIKSAIERALQHPDELLCMAVNNNRTARSQYRTASYNANMKRILESAGENGAGQ